MTSGFVQLQHQKQSGVGAPPRGEAVGVIAAQIRGEAPLLRVRGMTSGFVHLKHQKQPGVGAPPRGEAFQVSATPKTMELGD